MADVDKLEVDVILSGTDESMRKVDEFVAKVENADRTINALGEAKPFGMDEHALKRFETGLDTSIDKGRKLRQTIDAVIGTAKQANTPIWTSFIKGATEVQDKARILNRELKDIKAIASGTTDPVLLDKLKLRSVEVNAELSGIERKINRVVAGRAAVARRRAANQIDVGGLTELGVSSLPPEARLAVDAAKMLKISAASAGIIGGVAVAGVAIVKLSEKLKEDAEKKLKLEEGIAAAINAQIIGRQKALKLAQDEIKEATALRALNRSFDEASKEELQSRRETFSKLLELNPVGENAEKFKNIIIDIDSRIESLQQRNTDLADAAFSQRWETWKQQQQQAIEQEEKANEKLKEQAREAAALREEVANFVTSIEVDKNPLVGLMTEFETATERAEKRFGAFGKQFASQMAEIEKTAISSQIDKALFDIEQRALRIQQELTGLQSIDSNRGIRQERAGVLGARVDAFLSNKSIEESIERLTDRFNSGQDALQRDLGKVAQLRSFELTSGAGAEGASIIAQSIRDILGKYTPEALRDYGGAGMNELIKASQVQIEDNNRKLEDAIAQAKITEKAREDALALVGQVRGSKLSERERNAQILALTGELPADALGGDLKQARIDALKGTVKDTLEEKKEAREAMKSLSAFLEKIDASLSENGLKIDFGEKALIDLTIASKDLTVEEQTKRLQESNPSQKDVAATYAEYQAAF